MLLLNLEVTSWEWDAATGPKVTPRDAMLLLDLEVTSWGPEATVRPSPLSPSPVEGWSMDNIFCLPCPVVGMGGTCLAHVKGAPCSQALVGWVGCWEWVPFLKSANRCCRNQDAECGFLEGVLGGSCCVRLGGRHQEWNPWDGVMEE